MRYENNERLRQYLDRGAAGAQRELIGQPAFDLDEHELARHLAEVRSQHPQLTEEEAVARAAFRVLTIATPSGSSPADTTRDENANQQPHWEASVTRADSAAWSKLRRCAHRAWPFLKAAWAIALLLLVAAIASHAAPRPDPNALRAVRNAFALPAEPQATGGLILQFQNAGTPLATRPTGFVAINCGTNMSCSFGSGVFTLSSSSTASTAFGALTAGPNNNTGTFSASGNSWDFSAATEFLVPWQTSATLPGTTGQLLFNNGGVIGAEDPVVSGPDAPGSAPTKNPVQIGGFDGTYVRRVLTDASGNVEVNVANTPTVTANAGSGTFSVSGSVTATEGGSWNVGQSGTWTVDPGNTANSTPWLFSISQGGNTAAVSAAGALKVDGSAVTQPVTGTVTANAGSGNFTVVQPTGTNLHMVCDSGCSSSSSPSYGATFPSTGTPVGFSDGTNMQAGHVFDLDSGAGTEYDQGVSIRLSSSGGSAEGGTATHPLRVDPTGTTTQPVSGTVTANAGTGNFATNLAQYNGSTVGASNPEFVSPPICNPNNIASAVYDASTSGATQLVALSSGKTIYVCGFQISTSQTTAVSVKLVYGTGTNCGTGSTAMTPAYPLQAPSSTGPIGMVLAPAHFFGVKTAASNALCISTNAAASVQALVWYVQQ
jgi:hypothetical protein